MYRQGTGMHIWFVTVRFSDLARTVYRDASMSVRAKSKLDAKLDAADFVSRAYPGCVIWGFRVL